MTTFDPITLAVLLAAMALMPTLVVVSTAFLKIVVVMSLLRNALGVQQTPPNLAERRVDSPPIPAKMHHSLQFVQSMQRLGSVTRPRMGGVATGWAAHMQSTSRWAFT